MSTAFPHTKPNHTTDTSAPVEIGPFHILVKRIKRSIEKNKEIVRIPFSKKVKKILKILERSSLISCDPRSYDDDDDDFIIRISVPSSKLTLSVIQEMRVMEMPIFYSFMGKEVKATFSDNNIKVSECSETYVVVYTLGEVHVLSTKSIARCEVYERDLTTATDL